MKQLRVRDAQAKDFVEILELTSAMRGQLAVWSPVYFRPRAGADAAHAQFLEFVIGSPDQQASVFVHEDTVVGFFRRANQPHHIWVDDLCLQDPKLWGGVAELLAGDLGSGRWVTCASTHDTERLDALSSAGATPISSYWSKLLDESPPDTDASQVAGVPNIPKQRPDGPAHTFGGVAFDPSIPGALAVSDDRGNYAIGSPSVEPPIYDPGGPTCVVDQIGGPDRGIALNLAQSEANGRGDAQLVVVSASDDEELRRVLEAKSFQLQVVLLARRGR
ncbi:hypothetical protein [Candidatus Poriferisocius sp.]|uniref:hypothetical protein n=1 Tax=Candidatus Poriferisocius sp. TaxID=3101276 RepID=UPI003B02E644